MRSKRILVVDDSELDTELVLHTFADSNTPIEARRVDTAAALIAEITSDPPDLILSDFHLPTLNALQVLDLLKVHGFDIPVIVVTGTLSEEVAALCLNHGAVDYVLKDRLVRLPSAVDRALHEKTVKTEREQALQALRESELRFRQVTESIDEVFWLTDIAGHVIYVSPAYQKVWGRTCQSILEASHLWKDAIHAADQDDVTQIAEKLRESGTYDMEYRILRPEGELRWIRDRAFPVADSEGKVYRIAGVAEDITQRRQLEDQLRQAQKMEIVGQLAGSIAHDFNNLLTVISGYSQLISSRLDEQDRVRHGVEQINKAAFRAASMTRRLLTFSRKQILQPRVTNLNDVISSIEGMLDRLIGENVQLEVTLDPQLALVKVDPGQIEQVIFNLVVNARDAMPQGGLLTIETGNIFFDAAEARRRQSPTEGWQVLLTIRDSGLGMDTETLARLFEPFFTTKPPGKGTGLGLATVHRIVQQSKGSIWVDTEVGRGSIFQIGLPRVDGMVEASGAPAESSSPPGEGTILLVEPDNLVRELTRDILERNGYTVLEARSGEEALTIGRSHRQIRLMLTEAVMAGASGPQLRQQIATSQPSMKVLFMSGQTDDILHKHGIVESGGPILTKPFSPEVLLQRIKHILDTLGES
jgi:two-component system cell cycle sensor histidine kinase/response regulator CckA